MPVIIALLIIYAVIAWRDFNLAVGLFLAALPAYLLRLEPWGLPTTMLELMFGVMLIFWLIKTLKEKPSFAFIKPWLIPFLLVIIAGAFSWFIVPDKMAALGVLKAYLIEPSLFFLILFTTIKNLDGLETILKFLGLGTLIISLFAIYQHLTGNALPIPWDVERRATGLFPYPNAVGLYLGPIIILGLGAAWRALENKLYPSAWFWFLTIGAAVAAIIFSETEAAWLAIPAALLIIGLLHRATRLQAVVLIVISLVVFFSSSAVRQKILLQDYSGGVRLKQWEESLNMLKDNWLFGAGLSGYPDTLQPYHTHPEIEIFQYPHNLILNIWSELGLLGLLAAVYLTLVAILMFYRGRKNPAAPHWLVFISAAALLEMFIHGLVDVPFFKNDLAFLTITILVFLTWATTNSYVHETNLFKGKN